MRDKCLCKRNMGVKKFMVKESICVGGYVNLGFIGRYSPGSTI